MSIVDWIEESVPGGHRLAARPAARRRLQHRVRRRVERAELAQPDLPARLHRPGPVAHLRQVEREVPRARRQRPDPVRLADGARRADHDRLGARRDRRRRRRAATRSVQAGHDDRRSPPTSVVLALRSRSCAARRLLEGRASPRASCRRSRELGMGTNSKLHVQFTRRHWSALGSNGETYSDRGYQNTWEVSRAQPGTPGSSSTTRAARSARASAPGRRPRGRSSSSRQIEPVLPGLTALWNGKATLDYWTGYPWTRAPTRTGRSASTRVRRHRGPAGGELPLRRRAHVDRLPGLPERRRRDRRARGRRGDRRPRIAPVGDDSSASATIAGPSFSWLVEEPADADVRTRSPPTGSCG